MTDRGNDVSDSKIVTEPEKITTVKKKDPKRVEAGKKLAAISKAAKEKKMRNMIEMEKSVNNSDSFFTKGKSVIAIVIVIAAATLFLLRKKSEKPQKSAIKESNISDSGKKDTILENL